MGAELELTEALTVLQKADFCGVMLDPVHAFFSTGRSLDGADGGVPRQLHDLCVPPAALVPRADSEPVRADIAWPPHPRGTGRVWPPEARFDSSTRPGRYPLAFAWHDFVNPHAKPWTWKSSGTPHELSAHNAIAAVFSATIRGAGCLDLVQPPVLVIPNHLSTERQQTLIDAANQCGTKIRLLWRPVAAALEWCQRHADLARSTRHGQSVGELIVLHLGLDEWEVTVLDVRAEHFGEERLLVPARRRPLQGAVIPSFGLDLAQHFAFRHIASVYGGESPEELWNVLWATPFLSQVISVLGGENCDESLDRVLPEFGRAFQTRLQNDWRELFPRLGATWPSNGSFLSAMLPKWAGANACSAWQQSTKSRLIGKKIIGAVVSGPMAMLMQPGGQRLGTAQLQKFYPVPERTLIENDSVPAGFLAGSAALYASMLDQKGRPTYLDTLPQLNTVVTRNGLPTWESLLHDGDQFVPGGNVWHRKPNLGGLLIKSNTEELTLVVHHEEHHTVREVKADLRRVKVSKNEPVSLAISVEPAAGNAKLEVVPGKVGLFANRRVFVEWKRMQDTGKPPKKYLDDLPRIFPDLLKRHSSSAKWHASRSKIESVLNTLQGTEGVRARLQSLREALRLKDTSQSPEDYTAIDSDGMVAAGIPNENHILDRLVKSLVGSLRSGNNQGLSRHKDQIISVLACTSTADADFQGYLVSRLQSQKKRIGQPDLKDHELSAIGWCLRDENGIAIFAEVMEKRLNFSISNCNNWLKAFSEILRYRDTATKEIPSSLCHSLSEVALKVFVDQARQRSLRFLFRYSALIIVYLLRRRAWDDDYMAPDEPYAVRAKEEFDKVWTALDNNMLDTFAGGAVDIKSRLRLMIDYIDRQGRGDFLGFDQD